LEDEMRNALQAKNIKIEGLETELTYWKQKYED